MSERADRLEALVAEHELDALIVGDLVRPGDSAPHDAINLRWLTGFGGTSGLALIGPGLRLFVTDFRYFERAENELAEGFELVRAERQIIPALAGRLEGRIGYDPSSTSVLVHSKLADEIPDGVELVDAMGLLDDLRRTKDAAEIEAIAEAAKLCDAAYRRVLDRGLAGRTEREVAREAVAEIRLLGGEPAFPPIVGAGENGALPHAFPSDRRIELDELVVFDMGAHLDDYCSDCTRTFATGDVGGEAREVYELVRGAQAAALDAIEPGASGRGVDSIARELIDDAGHAERFGHGTGHGVGMEVHEAPRLSQTSEDDLKPGDVVTVEPGVYVPGRFGVRIEDLVVVTEDGARNLSSLPKELQIVG